MDYSDVMTRGPLSALISADMFGHRVPMTTVSAAHAHLIVVTARALRMAKVKRSGQRGRRAYTLIPRKRSEWVMTSTYGKRLL